MKFIQKWSYIYVRTVKLLSFHMHWVQAFPTVAGARGAWDPWLTSASQFDGACKMQQHSNTLSILK